MQSIALQNEGVELGFTASSHPSENTPKGIKTTKTALFLRFLYILYKHTVY